MEQGRYILLTVYILFFNTHIDINLCIVITSDRQYGQYLQYIYMCTCINEVFITSPITHIPDISH